MLLSVIRIVRPTSRGLVETMGKYTKYAEPGFHWVVPVIQKLYLVNITEQMFSAEPQVIRGEMTHIGLAADHGGFELVIE